MHSGKVHTPGTCLRTESGLCCVQIDAEVKNKTTQNKKVVARKENKKNIHIHKGQMCVLNDDVRETSFSLLNFEVFFIFIHTIAVFIIGNLERRVFFPERKFSMFTTPSACSRSLFIIFKY